MRSLITSVVLLGETAPVDIDPSTGKGPEWGKAAPIGLLVILLMGIATFFLLRSMTRNLKKVPASFDPIDEEQAAVEESSAEPAAEPDAVAGPAAGPSIGPGPPPGLVDERSV
jgi:hypothetical protein